VSWGILRVNYFEVLMFAMCVAFAVRTDPAFKRIAREGVLPQSRNFINSRPKSSYLLEADEQ
jgi:hypothetical protein